MFYNLDLACRQERQEQHLIDLNTGAPYHKDALAADADEIFSEERSRLVRVMQAMSKSEHWTHAEMDMYEALVARLYTGFTEEDQDDKTGLSPLLYDVRQQPISAAAIELHEIAQLISDAAPRVMAGNGGRKNKGHTQPKAPIRPLEAAKKALKIMELADVEPFSHMGHEIRFDAAWHTVYKPTIQPERPDSRKKAKPRGQSFDLD